MPSPMKPVCLRWLPLLALLLLGGCRSKDPLVLLKPKQDLALGRPAGAVAALPANREAMTLAEETVVRLDTNQGEILIALDAGRAPVSVGNFLGYAESGYYDATLFHRVVPGFVIQGGGYTVSMEEKPTRAPIRNESDNGLLNRRGTVAMARRDAVDSATAQFFINLEDNPFLDADGPYGGYAVFGRVIDGMDVVDRIAKAATKTSGSFENLPVDPVIIRTVSVVRRPAGP